MNEHVRAAGGIVLRDVGDGRSVALVHRPRYDDWSFPKGKLIDGEDDETAALREVEEETGLRCRIGPSVGSVMYRDRQGRSKVVRYFRMDADDGSFTPSEEVDELRWVPVDRAGGLLSYAHDRNLLRRALAEAPASPLYLIRHAMAGVRAAWERPDHERPLTRGGRMQALRLVERFRGLELGRVLSSPYVRCVQTVEPLAADRQLALEPEPALAEGAHVDDALTLIASLDGRPAALCGHGREIQAMIDRLAGEGAAVQGTGIAKGSVWVLHRELGRVRTAHYLAPPG